MKTRRISSTERLIENSVARTEKETTTHLPHRRVYEPLGITRLLCVGVHHLPGSRIPVSACVAMEEGGTY